MKKILSFAALALLALPVSAHAQTSQTATASVIVSDIISLSITNATISFGTATAAGVRAGDVSTGLSVSANTTHTVRLTPGATHFDAVAVANDGVIPSSRIEWTKDAGTTWTAFSGTTAQDVVTSRAAGSSLANTISYRMTVTATDPKDTYSLSMTYSVISG